MAMSKKDFQAIATIAHRLRVEKPACCAVDKVGMWHLWVEELADVCKRSNPLFDRERFLEACTTGRCRGMKR